MKKTILFAIGKITPVLIVISLLTKFPGLFIPQKPTQSGMDKAMEQEFMLTRDPALNYVPRERLLKAEQYRRQKLDDPSSLMAPISGITWTERGPSNIGGRTRAIWFDLNDAPAYKKVWGGGVAGGLWYTNDITANNPVWNKVSDFMDNLAITTIAQSASNPQKLYAGTGEGWYNSDAVRGFGIWRSENGGASWSQLPSTNNSSFYYVQKIVVDGVGNVYACTRSAGLQKSTDGGNSWTKILGTGVNNGVGNQAADIEIAPNGDLYCSLGIFSTGKIYRSINGGASWTDISPSVTAQRIELATCPSSADTVYALFQDPSYDCSAIMRYTVSASSWANCAVPTIIDQGSNSNFTRGQAWYDLIASVDPNSASTLYIGGVDALRSRDAGATWTQMTTWSTANASGFSQVVHADHHAFVYVPGSSSRAVLGTDGGIYYADNVNVNNGKPNFASKNNGYNVTQYYAGALHPTKPDYFLGGAQDNGSHKFTNPGVNAVGEVSGGDGAFCHIDQDNPSVQITSYVYNNYFVSSNGGNTFNAIFKNNRGSFINPTDYDDLSNILYGADNGGYFFRWNSPGSNGTDQQVSVSTFSNQLVTHVRVSPLTANRVYFGLYNGSVVMVDNAHTGTSLTGTVIKTASSGPVSSIAIDPSNENHMLVSHSYYGVTSVYECLNAQQASPGWTAIEGNLPDMPVRWAMFDPRNADRAILATELGVWSTSDIDGAATDWSPTNTGFANVRVDMLDYRSSDGVLLAVTHGRGMYTTVLPQPTTPDINFSTAYSMVTETVFSTDSCKAYKDYTVNLTIANAPTGDATLTLKVDSPASASNPYDYIITTNGNFISPSNVLTFPSGLTTSRQVTVRVFDDPEVENTESFTIRYTLSGTSNAQIGSGPQQHTVYIYDNDAAPVAANISQYTIGTASYYLTNSLSGTGSGQPFDAKLQKKKTRIQYRSSELTAAGVTAGNITSIQFNFGIVNSKRDYTNLQIRMGHSTVPNLVDNGAATIEAVTTCATIPVFSPVTGWNTFELSTPFAWNGSNNIIIEICYDNGTKDSTDLADIVVGYKDGATASQGNMFWQDNLDCSGSYTSTIYYSEGLKPQAKFGVGVQGTSIATLLNTSRTIYLGPYSDVYVYSATSEIIARIKNLTSHDYGCTQVWIDRAGTDAKPFLSNTPASYLMDKTFRILPAVNNPSGSYELTLYFTNNEVAGWQNATGQTFDNIQLVKVQGKISDVTPSTPTAAGTIQSFLPTRGIFGVYRTLKYTVTNGFSGFGAGVIGTSLPIQFIDFTGVLRNNAAVLTWTTTNEKGTQAFQVERSYDGIAFQAIGQRQAAGNSISTVRYNYVDNDLTQDRNFYRIRTIDQDGRTSLTQTILIRNPLRAQGVFRIMTNPVSQYLELEWGIDPPANGRCAIYDASGKIILEKGVTGGLSRIRIDLSGVAMAKGMYVVQLQSARGIYSQRFMKE